MTNLEYKSWVKVKGDQIMIANLPAIFPCIDSTNGYLSYNTKGKLYFCTEVKDDVENLSDESVGDDKFTYSNFSSDVWWDLLESRIFIQRFKQKTVDWSKNDHEKVLPNKASLVYLANQNSIDRNMCAKHITRNIHELDRIMFKFFNRECDKVQKIIAIPQGGEAALACKQGKPRIEHSIALFGESLKYLELIDEVLPKYNVAKGVVFTDQLISKLDFRELVVKFLIRMKMDTFTVIQLEKHMESHGDSLMFRIYNAKFKLGLMCDFANGLEECCRKIIYGAHYKAPRKNTKKRERPDWYVQQPAPKMKSGTRRIPSEIAAVVMYAKITKPLVKVEIPNLVPFELKLEFDEKGQQMKMELSDILNFLRNLKDENFEKSDEWTKINNFCEESMRNSRFDFTVEIWRSLYMLHTHWTLTKDFVLLNYGYQLISFALNEDGLNCEQLVYDSGQNLENSLIFPEINGLEKDDLISNEIYEIIIA